MIALDKIATCSYPIYRMSKKNSKRRKLRFVTSISAEPDPKRHKRMVDGGAGFMFYSTARFSEYPNRSAGRVEPEQKKKWMFSKEACKYLGCSRRHLYWLVSNGDLPYFVFTSSPSPRYVFRSREVDEWLKTYRGKGRQLGLRKIRLSGSGETVEKGK